MRLALVAASVMLATGAAWAASPRLVTTEAGRDAPIGAAPEVRIARAPVHGTIVVQDTRLAGRGAESCAPVVALTRQVTHRPMVGFSGQDEVLFEIVDLATGRSDPHPVTIVVQPTPTGI